MDKAEFIVAYKDEEDREFNLPLDEAAGLPFHRYCPVRKLPAHRRQWNLPGYYWFATTEEHILYESQLELAHLMLLDFDLEVANVSAQPFRLFYSDERKRRSHVPDYFAKLYDGRERLVDVKRAEQAAKPKVRRVLDVTHDACRVAGWEYAVATEPSEPYLTNVRWLSAFRRPQPRTDQFAENLIDACADGPHALSEVVRAVGEPMLARPVLFRLLWLGILSVPLNEPLTNDSPVSLPERSSSVQAM